MKTMAFIGTGRMGSAVIRAVCHRTEPSEICIANRTPQKAMYLAEQCGCVMSQNNSAAARGAKYVVLSVPEEEICGVLREIAPVLTEEQIILTFSARVSAHSIQAAAGMENPVIRVLPSAPCEIGKGLVLIVACSEVSGEIIGELQDLFSGCGMTGCMDGMQAAAGMTVEGAVPVFAYVFLEALADGAVSAGMKRETALEWTAQALAGAAQMVLKTGRHPGVLRDEACSPAGPAIAGVKALEEGGFRAAVMAAVERAFQKNSEIGK